MPVALLASAYDAASDAITMRLVARDDLAPGWRLAFTSIVQIDPDSSARLVERVSSFHLVEPVDRTPLPRGATWEVHSVSLSHRPGHASDGPVSAYLVLADSAIAPVDVDWLARVDAPDQPSRPSPRPPVAASPHPYPLVPFPAALRVDDPTPTGRTRFRLVHGDEDARTGWSAVADLAERLLGTSPLARRDLDHDDRDDHDGATVANVATRLSPELDPEQYELEIDGPTISVAAAGAAGFRHAFVTLAQWSTVGLPVRAAVSDRPRFPWRGVHLDVARQWIAPDLVEHMIDVAAWHKLSRLHLHLTDDEGWRVPIERRPRLGEVGGVRGHGLAIPPMHGSGPEPTGRAYTADEIRSWHVRARELGVVIVPEVDLPGHMYAALAAEPDLRDPDDRSRAESVQRYFDNVLVPGHPGTREFLIDVFDAVAELFPDSPWIHIGGDEVPAGAWSGSPIAERYRAERGLATVADIEGEFVRDVVSQIRKRHRRHVGAWQEAAECGGIAPDDGYVVGWRTAGASRSLAAAGFDVVVAPGQAYYLDMATSDDWGSIGASWAGTTTFDDVCRFDPTDGWSDDELAHLIGIQACLWTEHVRDDATFHHLVFPRLQAVAERAWTGEIAGGTDDLRSRCAMQEAVSGAGREAARRYGGSPDTHVG